MRSSFGKRREFREEVADYSYMRIGVALIPTAPEVPRNRDSLYPYRHDSYFYYLSGFPEPEDPRGASLEDVPVWAPPAAACFFAASS